MKSGMVYEIQIRVGPTSIKFLFSIKTEELFSPWKITKSNLGK